MIRLFTALLPEACWAAPDPVTVQGNTATAQGNQTNGILSGRDFDSPPVQILNVNLLSDAIRPRSGSTGIGFTNTRGGNITINAGNTSTNIVITTSGNQAPGIAAESRGTPPPAPTDPFLDVPIPGNPDVAGGVVEINTHSDIMTAGSGSHGIRAQSRTTGYDSDVIDALRNFSEAPFSFAVIGVTNADGSAGVVGQPVQGVLIGTNGSPVAGNGGLFILNPNGTFAFDPGTNFNLAAGETRVSSVNYLLAGSRSGMLLRTDIGGQLFVTVSNNGSGLEIIGSEAYFSDYGESTKPQTANVVFPDLQQYVQGLITTAEDAGGSGNSVEVAHQRGGITTTGAASHGIFAESSGKSGSSGRNGGGFFSFGTRPPSAGGSGNDGGLVSVTVNGDITTSFQGTANEASLGVFAFSQGGNGGRGGDGGFYYDGRRGGNGGDGGTVMVSGSGTIQTRGDFASGIYALSEGGDGGRGGDGGVFTDGLHGGYGGQGGSVFLDGLWNITTQGDRAYGIWAKSVGGNAGSGGSGGWISGRPGGGGRATDGGAVSVTSGGRIETFGADAFGIYGQSVGGFGGSGGSGGSIFVSSGGDGTSAGSGGAVRITQETNGTVTTHGDRSHAIYAQSVGGGGGSAGNSGGVVSLGGTGASGGNGRTVTVTNRGQLVTLGEQAVGIFAQSVGGGGGSSGRSGGAVSLGGSSGGGGAGGAVSVLNENTGSIQSGTIATMGDKSHAILAQSVGGGGGSAGNSGGAVTLGASGSDGGNGGSVSVFNSGMLVTTGNFSRGIFAQSIGGGGGAGGDSSGTVSLGGSSGSGGSGGIVTVVNENNGFLMSGAISTAGTNSHAIFAQSVGGGGGSAGNSDGAVTLGGSASGGSDAGAVTVNNSGFLQTAGAGARGIFAQSVGGGGGDGGLSIGAVSFGRTGGGGGNGAAVVVSNLNTGPAGSGAISTAGTRAHAIFAQSVGGGGGSGGGSGGLVSFGASGDAGGDASTVTIHNTGALLTRGSDASGIFAQSVGGGGGDGGNSVSVSAWVGFALAGSGAVGGASDRVNVFSGDSTIITAGDRSHGIFAQGVGGGGGNGGFAVGVAGGVGFSINATIGGNGGGGGDGSVVSVDSASSIATAGNDAHGIMAQSVGGGGGNGGFSVALGGSDGIAVSAGFGGSGGNGGVGKAVSVTSTGTLIATLGHGSSGLFAQSVGGGGGSGGFSIAGAGAGIGAGGISFGGSGGGGGDSASVLVMNSSSMTTRGDDAFGIFAQSVGGGGGNGRFSIAGAGAGTGSGAISIGGSGGLGGNASSVSVTNTGALIETFGNGSIAVLAQSIGGGGGNGGFSIAGAGAGTGSGGISVGGSGGGGGDGEMVRLLNGSIIRTHGEDAHGLFAQSLGGGGGNGRFSIAGAGAGTGAGVFNVGGGGGTGGVGKAVSLLSTGSLVETWGNAAVGLFAQSLGGGGGNGGFSIAGAGAGTGSGAVNFGLGGGDGGDGGSVQVENQSMIVTHGTNDAHAIFAQSIGGGGGNGRFSLSGAGAGTGSGTLNVGGAAGGGGEGKDVSVTNTGAWLETFGASSSGIFAQSVGGGGGNGGFSITGSGAKSGAGSVSVGGFGGAAGDAGAVTVFTSSRILTRGDDAHGILAQSLGGGGGNGRFSIVGSGASTGTGNLGIGGAGGASGDGKGVTVTNTGEWIETFGESSSGIFAQSVGGGGGNGGFSIAGSGAKTGAGSVSVGGFGGLGGDAGIVQVFSSSSILARGSNSHGILAQSLGGGGGNGRFSIAASGAISNSISASLGGFGGTGGFGSQVIVISSGPLIETRGPNSRGILAQSIGGGGGNGGFSGAGALSFGGTNAKVLSVSVGGFAGGGNDANKVSVVNSSAILSSGEDGGGIMAQSLGGGGGNGGGTFTGSLSGSGARELAVAVGGLGGTGGHGGEVSVTNAGSIVTTSNRSEAILAQSVGGGGGRGGFAIRADVNVLGTNASMMELGVTIGGLGGLGGNGGAVSVLTTNALVTLGKASHGILAQSIGGGGGAGGASTSFEAFLGASSASNTNSLNVDVGVGGFGGSAGSGSNVQVISHGRIETAGADAHGIFAQSIGGGGGNGGDVELRRLQFSGSNPGETNITQANLAHLTSETGTNSISTNQSRSWSLSASVGIGGRGGSAGDGGTVTVRHEGDIITRSNGSRGIFAQSVGGGGGAGGASTTESGDGNANRVIGIGVSLGGNGGGGGTAGAVSVTSLGTIMTSGDDAHGILAQSVGGGGGTGGASTSVSEKSKAGEDTTLAVTVQVGVGGAGGVAGHGGSVTVTNLGLIDTSGRKAYGILAQSVGGGGGFGGSTKVEQKSEKETNASPIALLAAMNIAASTNAPSGTNNASGGKTNTWNVNVSIGAGGAGGSAGNAGAVAVDNEGDIVTRGAESVGIFAQSVGGGGGGGGSSSTEKGTGSADRVIGIGVSLGGQGGIGGTGDVVRVSSHGTIVTLGDDAHGIMAQSVGGGGGMGGAANSTFETAEVATETVRAATVTVGLGGAGGVAGNGGIVTVTNEGLISTSGRKAYGILAQSIGGGGGFGGTTKIEHKRETEATNASTSELVQFGARSVSASTNGTSGTNMPSAGGTNSWNLNVTIGAGGAGGSAGDGGAVNVDNQGDIITRGQESVGIFAQSVGGGGGAGGASSTDNAGGSGDRVIGVALSLGGQGTNGGSGAAVTVNNRGTIVTLGDDAHGIMAQSVGGGGGAGGASTAVSETIETQTNTMRSASVTVGLGGSGGTGGNGGAVTVTNRGLIDTSGRKAYGILAQSIGGGGGFGGTTRAEQKQEKATNTSELALFRTATVAASTNGTSGTNMPSAGRTNRWNLNVTIGAGGAGGSAGNGGAVTVDNQGNIITRGEESQGIFAQSVGGGGGAGGSSATENGGGNADRVLGIGLSLGGRGGPGGSGDSVTVTNRGAIVTLGEDAHGVMAQSVGGGGGLGGASLFIGEESGATNTRALTVNIGVGGTGGFGGSGSNVVVINEGSITTSGGGAFGIFAQSVGGGGGAGGSATHSMASNTFVQTLLDVQIAVGGSGTNGGNGGEVRVSQSGTVTTFGEGAYGVFAQSVGGGGGVGGHRTLGLTGKIALGGAGGASGNGGDVTVDFNGDIITHGSGTAGIFAQSIGGGGGLAGSVQRGVATFGPLGTATNLGVGLAFGRDGGAGGNGGAVTVNSSGRIVTFGEGSSGIFAQSVGGGGGLAGSLGTNLPALAFQNSAGSAGAAGSGGEVKINHTGTITTFGDNSHGIFIQSAGGEEDGGKINLELVGSIRVMGTNSDAIFVQSIGGRTNQDITITLREGAAQGGFGSGAAVRLSDGASNTLNNFNSLSTMSREASPAAIAGAARVFRASTQGSGNVIVGGHGDDIINNHNAITGSVDLGAGRNTFNNFRRFNAGAVVNLGAGNRLVNSGTLSPGGQETIQATTLDGDLDQISSGSLQTKLASASRYDVLAITGTAALDGKLSVLRFNNFVPRKRDEFAILTAEQGITGEFASVEDPLKGNYALQLQTIYTAGSVALQTEQDSFLQFALTRNQRAVARNLDSFSGLDSGFEDPRGAELIEFLNTVPGATLPGAYDQIAPEELGAVFDLGMGAADVSALNVQRRLAEIRAGSTGFSESLSLARPSQWQLAAHAFNGMADAGQEPLPSIMNPSPDNRWGIFATGSGEFTDVGGTANSSGYDFKSSGITVGADYRVNRQFAAGIMAGYLNDGAHLIDDGEVDVQGIKGGVYATWYDKGFYIDSAVEGGYHFYDTHRGVLGGTARGSTEGAEFDGFMGVGYDVKRDRLTLGPTLSLQYTYVGFDSFTETGSRAPLVVQDNDSHSFRTRLGGRLAYDLETARVTLRPEIRAAWHHEFLDSERAIDSRLASGAGSIFQVNSPRIGRDSLALSAGVTVGWSSRLSTSLFYDTQLARANYVTHAVNASLYWSF